MRYLKADTELGYVEDSAEIEYLKFNNLRHTILGCMLGDFDAEGKYIVSPEIASELISMKKYIVDSFENIEICESELKLDKPITFMITYENDSAALILVEKMSYEANIKLNSGTYSNINEFVLDRVETSGQINRNALYKRWNIGEFGGNQIDIFTCGEEVLEKYFGIVARFKYLIESNSVLLKNENKIDEIESVYANKMLEILHHYPKLETAVKKQIKQTLNEKKDFFSPNKPNFAKTINEVLDNAIQTNQNLLTENEKGDFLAEQHNVKNETTINRTAILETIQDGNVVELKTQELSGLSVQDVARRHAEINRQIVKETKASNAKTKLINNLIGLGVEYLAGEKKTELVEPVQENLVEKTAERANSNTKSAGKNDAKKTAKKADKKDVKKDVKKSDGKAKSTASANQSAGNNNGANVKKEEKKVDIYIRQFPSNNADIINTNPLIQTKSQTRDTAQQIDKTHKKSADTKNHKQERNNGQTELAKIKLMTEKDLQLMRGNTTETVVDKNSSNKMSGKKSVKTYPTTIEDEHSI